MLSVFCVLFALPFVLCANAQDANEEHYYDEYDDYYEMEQDYIDSEVVDKVNEKKQPIVFVPAIILGAAAGLGVTYIVLNAVFAPPKPNPYFRKAEEKHELVNKADEKIS